MINNSIIKNTQIGVFAGRGSANNLIFHNNFIDNTSQARALAPNNWFDATLLEGNFWSDYPGVDDGSGTGKHAIAGDGIGDTNIPWHSDSYPFIDRDGWLQPQDITPPVITISGDLVVKILVGETYTDDGATAKDDVDGPVPVTGSSPVRNGVG